MTDYNEKQINIMEAAETHFADRGFEGSSVRDIADTAGVNLAMISYYFGSKEKLLEAVFSYRSRFFTLALENMVQNQDLEPMQKVDLLIDQYIDKLLNQQCFHRIVVREQMVDSNSIITERLLQMKRTNQALITQLIQEGQQKKVFRKNVDVPLLMSTLVGTVGHLISTRQYYMDPALPQPISDEDFRKHIKGKVSKHIKFIFKSILTHED